MTSWKVSYQHLYIESIASSKEFKIAISSSTKKIEEKIKTEAHQEKEKFWVEYKQKVVRENNKRVEKLQKKIEEYEQQSETSNSQIEECKIMIMKMEEDKKEMITLIKLCCGKCQIVVII